MKETKAVKSMVINDVMVIRTEYPYINPVYDSTTSTTFQIRIADVYKDIYSISLVVADNTKRRCKLYVLSHLFHKDDVYIKKAWDIIMSIADRHGVDIALAEITTTVNNLEFAQNLIYGQSNTKHDDEYLSLQPLRDTIKKKLEEAE